MKIKNATSDGKTMRVVFDKGNCLDHVAVIPHMPLEQYFLALAITNELPIDHNWMWHGDCGFEIVGGYLTFEYRTRYGSNSSYLVIHGHVVFLNSKPGNIHIWYGESLNVYRSNIDNPDAIITDIEEAITRALASLRFCNE